METHGVRFIDLTGQKFNRLTVISFHSKLPRGASKWLCRCDCGKELVALAGNIKKKDGQGTTSCGCAHSEIVVRRNFRHGLARSKEYDAWSGAKGRVMNAKNKRFKYYGGRGVKMCDRWLESFENFIADMGSCPDGKRSLGRINNDGDYEPSNCRWESHVEQMNNVRTNHMISNDGETLTAAQWSRRTGLNASTILARIRSGVDPSVALKNNLTDP